MCYHDFYYVWSIFFVIYLEQNQEFSKMCLYEFMCRMHTDPCTGQKRVLALFSTGS